MSNRTFRRIAAVSLALLAAAHLGGCGSDGGSPSTGGTGGTGDTGGTGGTGGTDTTGSATGVFLDAPVAGLKFTTTPSNISGTTNADGQFTYNPGDTVTFALGDLVLGSVAAQGTVTPLTVAEALVSANPSGDVETITVNLLAFLQSLDSDGNADNGISIGTAVSGAMAVNAISFVADASAFTAALGSLVTTLEGATGTDLTVVSRDEATNHFIEQVPTLLAGTYVWATEAGVPVTENTRTLTLFENNTYLYGGHDNDPNCNEGSDSEDLDGNGVEFGTFDFNPLTRALTFAPTLETNGSCGLATMEDEPFTLNIEDGVVQIQTESELTYWVAVPSTTGELAGSWGLPVAMLNDQPLVVSFFPSATAGSGRYLLVDAMAADPEDQTSPGIEEGCYAIAGDVLTADLDPVTCTSAIDTNDTAGLSNPHAPYEVSVDAYGRLHLDENGEITDLVRLPLQAVTVADRVGTWYMDNGIAPQEDESLFVASLFEDGSYLLGGIHHEAACNEIPADQYQDANGNGAEFGQLVAADGGLHGVVSAAATTDTNGSCGLNAANDPEQRFMFVRSELEDSLLFFAWDESEGMVLKRVPSIEDGVTGAWSVDGLDAAHPHIAVFLPEGLLFEVSAEEGSEAGLWMSSYSVNEALTQLTINATETCLDTMGFPSCEEAVGDEIMGLQLDGNAMQVEEGGELYSYTKITP